MAEEINVNVVQPEGEPDGEPVEEGEESLWPEIRSILQSIAETARTQSEALSAMTQKLSELQMSLPSNLQQMLESQQATIQTLVRESLETVRANLLTPNPPNPPEPSPEPEPVAVVVPEEWFETPPAEPEPPAKHRTRRRI